MLKFEQEFEVTAELVAIDTQAWSYSVDVPVTITVEAVVFETPTGPIVSVGVLQLTGTVIRSGNQIQLVGTSSLELSEVVQDPPISFEDVPFDVPTIIPPGEIAHLLLSATAETATVTTSANLQFVAVGITKAAANWFDPTHSRHNHCATKTYHLHGRCVRFVSCGPSRSNRTVCTLGGPRHYRCDGRSRCK